MRLLFGTMRAWGSFPGIGHPPEMADEAKSTGISYWKPLRTKRHHHGEYLTETPIPLAELKQEVRDLRRICSRPDLLRGGTPKQGDPTLIDGIVDYLPSPVDVPPIAGHNPVTGNEESRTSDPKVLFPPWHSRSRWIRVAR